MNQKAGTIIHTVNRLNKVFTVAWSVSGVEKGYFATETESDSRLHLVNICMQILNYPKVQCAANFVIKIISVSMVIFLLRFSMLEHDDLQNSIQRKLLIDKVTLGNSGTSDLIKFCLSTTLRPGALCTSKSKNQYWGQMCKSLSLWKHKNHIVLL